MKDITIKRETVVVVGIILIIAILVGSGFYANNRVKTYIADVKLEGQKEGYDKALVDIAYTIAKNGEVIYTIPTTNITIDLVLKK
jgi:hypothetical protein